MSTGVLKKISLPLFFATIVFGGTYTSYAADSVAPSHLDTGIKVALLTDTPNTHLSESERIALMAAPETDQASILREEIRSALIADPRSASISPNELNALIETLAEEAEAQNVVADFVPAPPPVYESVSEFAYGIITPWGQPIAPVVLYGVVLLCLLCAVFMLAWLLRLHRHADRV